MTDPESVKFALDKAATISSWLYLHRPTNCPDAALMSGEVLREASDVVTVLASRVHELEAAEVERQGRVCGRCQHRITQFREDDPCCGLTQMSDGVHVMVTYVPCRFLGHTCGAWSPRTEGT